MKFSFKYFRASILGLLLFCVNYSLVSQNNTILDSNLVFHDKSIQLSELLNLIESTTDIKLTYSPGQINNFARIEKCANPCSVIDYLNKIARVSNLKLVVNNSDVFLYKNYSSTGDTDFSISGYVRDFETGELLLGATIVSIQHNIGITTDENGFFYFKNISKNDTIRISYIGYSPLLLFQDSVGQSIQSVFYLKKSNILKDIIIDTKSNINVFNYSKFDSYKSLMSLDENTSVMGNNDVLKDLTKLAGIEKINDLQGGISINGLSPQDNIYLLDGVRVFEPNHIFGLFSAFNKSSINKVSIHSNCSPLKYYDAFSGVVNSHLIEGDFKQHSADFSISNSNVGMFVTGPLLKYKTSYFFDLRKSILNFYLPQLVKLNLNFENLDFYDVNFKITHRVAMGNKINIFFYHGNDNVRINNSLDRLKTTNRYNWGNLVYGLKWQYLFSNSLKSVLVFSFSDYNNRSTSIFEVNKNPFEKSYLSIFSLSKIRETSLKHDFKMYAGNSVFKFGYKISEFGLQPILKGEISEDVIAHNSFVQSDKDSLYYSSACYFANEYSYQKFKISTGFKIGYLFKSHIRNVYFNPKIKLDYHLSKKSVVTFSYMKSSKLVHSLGSYSVGIPSMLWSVSNVNLPISESFNYSINYLYYSGKLTFITELYYKKMKDILEYKNISDVFNPVSAKGAVLPTFSYNGDISKNILIGSGRAYGTNLSVNYRGNRIALNGSFSINRVFVKFDGINSTKEFRGNYDLIYSSFFGVKYKIKKMLFLTDWHIHSGQVFSLPEHVYKDINGNEVLDYLRRNNKSMELYNSISIGVAYEKFVKNVKIKLSFGISNIFSNFNPVYAYLYRTDDFYKVSQVSGLPILPYLRINIKL